MCVSLAFPALQFESSVAAVVRGLSYYNWLYSTLGVHKIANNVYTWANAHPQSNLRCGRGPERRIIPNGVRAVTYRNQPMSGASGKAAHAAAQQVRGSTPPTRTASACDSPPLKLAKKRGDQELLMPQTTAPVPTPSPPQTHIPVYLYGSPSQVFAEQLGSSVHTLAVTRIPPIMTHCAKF